MISRSLKVPFRLVGVDDEVVRLRYLVGFGTKLHFRPVGKNAPPRPRRLEALSSATISSGVISFARRSAASPPAAS